MLRFKIIKMEDIKFMQSGIFKKMVSLVLAFLMVAPTIVQLNSNLAVQAAEPNEYVPIAAGKTLGECFPDVEFRNYIYNMVIMSSQESKLHKLQTRRYRLTQSDVDDIKMRSIIIINYNDNLKNLTGIQNFESLNFLDCHKTGVTNLDVTNNKDLISLNCSDTNLTELDITHNTNLTTLMCDGTDISNLNTTNNPELDSLYCSGTNIRSLDISRNRKLTELNCSDTHIEDLNLTRNSQLKKLECYNTDITSLYVCDNQNLCILNCDKSRLKYLDLSGKKLKKDMLDIYSEQNDKEQKVDFKYEQKSCNKYKILDIPIDGRVSELKINGRLYNKSTKKDIVVNEVPTKISYKYNTNGTVDGEDYYIYVTSENITEAY